MFTTQAESRAGWCAATWESPRKSAAAALITPFLTTFTLLILAPVSAALVITMLWNRGRRQTNADG